MSNIADLNNWHGQSLPVWSGWNKSGFPLKWYTDRIREGYRCIPPIYLIPYDYPEASPGGAVKPTSFQYFYGTQLAELDYINSLKIPIVLRYDNVAQMFYSARYRGKPIEQSPLVFKQVNGVLTETANADYLGAPGIWEKEGNLLGSSPYVSSIANRITNPSLIIHLENHEVGLGVSPTGPNVAVPLTPGPVQWTPDGLGVSPALKWQPVDAVRGVSVRLADRIAQGLSPDPWTEYANLCQCQINLYSSYYRGLRNALPSVWKDSQFLTGAYSSGRTRDWQLPPVVTNKYGWAPDALLVDGAGEDYYLGTYVPYNLTDPKLPKYFNLQRPAWEYVEKQNVDSFRLIFVYLEGDYALKAAKEGKHPPVSPDMWQAFVTWIMWCNRGLDAGVPLMINQWTRNATKPEDLLFSSAQNQTDLSVLNRSDLKTATHGDYCISSLKAVNSILDNDVIRDFWLNGSQVSVDTPTVGPVKVWAVAFKYGGRVLVYAWSPFKDLGVTSVNVSGVGNVQLNFNGRHSVYRIGRPPVGTLEWSDL